MRLDTVHTLVHDTSDPEVIIAEGELEAALPATEHHFTSRFVLVARVRAGRIVHLRDSTDALRVARGMGRLPELVSAFN